MVLSSGGGAGGTALYAVNGVVLGVGMSTFGRKRLCTPRIGDSQVPMTLEHDKKKNVSLGRMTY